MFDKIYNFFITFFTYIMSLFGIHSSIHTENMETKENTENQESKENIEKKE